MKNFYQKGITLWEVLLAIAILGILIALVLPGFAKIRKIQILKSTTEEIVSVVGKARSQTLAGLDASPYGVHFETNRVIIFKGTSFLSDEISNQVIDLISPATISSINLNNSGTDIYFNRLSGLPNTAGTITVSIPEISSKIITISATGSASVN